MKTIKKTTVVVLAVIMAFSGLAVTVTADQTPSVTTHSATNITEDSARLNGYINPHDDSAKAWFVYGTSKSNLSKTTPKESIGSSSTQFHITVTDLSPGTTYYFKAIGENSYGENPHDVRSFTTSGEKEICQTPSVTTHSATNITEDSARLNGYINPHDDSAKAWFEWGTSSSNLNQTTSKKNIGSSSEQFNTVIDGLSPDTTYYFRAVGENSCGENPHDIRSFTTKSKEECQTPSLTTHSATNITEDSARLNGYINPHDDSAKAWFEWGTSSSNLNQTTSKKSIGSTSTQFSADLSSLSSDTTYYFRAVGENSCGKNAHDVRSFNTKKKEVGQTPSVTTHSATDINQSTATLNGYINPHDDSAKVWFKWGTSSSNLNKTTSKKSIGSSSTQFNQGISGLSEGTTYYFRAMAENVHGESKGSIRSFKKEEKTKDPWGYLECVKVEKEAIKVFYEGENLSDARLFREDTKLLSVGSGSEDGYHWDKNLSPDTEYTYYLRDGKATSYKKLAEASCRTLRDDAEEELIVYKKVKSKDQDTGFSKSLNVSPDELLVYSIEVFAEEEKAENVVVEDILSKRLQYEGNLKLDGSSISGDIRNGVNIGDISAGKSKVITFEARTAPEDDFLIGTTSITNVANVSSDKRDSSDSATVHVERVDDKPPTEVPTGITGNTFFDYLFIPFLLALLATILFRKHIVAFIKKIEEARYEMSEEWI